MSHGAASRIFGEHDTIRPFWPRLRSISSDALICNPARIGPELNPRGAAAQLASCASHAPPLLDFPNYATTVLTPIFTSLSVNVNQLILEAWRRKVPGGAAGLQNQSGGRKVPGGFDSLPSPPHSQNRSLSSGQRPRNSPLSPRSLGAAEHALKINKVKKTRPASRISRRINLRSTEEPASREWKATKLNR